MNHLFDDCWVTLCLPLLYNPSFSTPWTSFVHFTFGEQEESPRVRLYLWFLREERILFEFSRFSISSKFVKWEKLFQVWKLKLFTHFWSTRHSLIKLQTFSFIEPHETYFFIAYCKNIIFNRNLWNTSRNWMRHGSFWSRMKILSYEVMFNFLVFGHIFIARAWFWLFNHFFKFESLRTWSTQNHMTIGNKVQDLSKCIIKIP